MLCVALGKQETLACLLPPLFPPSYFSLHSSFFFFFIFQNSKVRTSKAKMFTIEPGPGAAQYLIFIQSIAIFIKIPKGLMKGLSKRSCLKSFPVVTPLVDDHHLPSLLTVSISTSVATLFINSKQDTGDNDKCVNSEARHWKNIFMHYFILH